MNSHVVPDILIAEDSSNDAELAIEALTETRLTNRLVVVADGAEALDFLYRRGRFTDRIGPQPAVFLLDIKMPKLNGLEVLRRIKADPELANMPVVMLSSSREERDLREARALGAQAYVVKPIGFHEFMAAVKTVGSFWASLNVLWPPNAPEPRGSSHDRLL